MAPFEFSLLIVGQHDMSVHGFDDQLPHSHGIGCAGEGKSPAQLQVEVCGRIIRAYGGGVGVKK